MSYCKMYDKKEDVDCKKCSKENDFSEWYCCLNECGQHEFCRGCKVEGHMRRGRETKLGNSIPDRLPHNIHMPKVKEQKENASGITIDVECKGIEEALTKARELVGVLEKIDGLTGRIVRDIDKINRYELGKQI